MNTTLAPVRSLETDRLLRTGSASTGANLGFADRLELRLGLWLLLRSARRFDAANDHSDHRRLRTNSRSQVEREYAALRAHALVGVRT
jgi:hypothetical protein